MPLRTPAIFSTVIRGLDPRIQGWFVLFEPRSRKGAIAIPYYLYILASRRNGTLYVGVTNDIVRRGYEHRHGLVEGFTERHRVHHLGYVEPHTQIAQAIRREKAIKHWSRAWKIALIERDNPQWLDLYETINA